jgi:hypothetical protein
MTIHRLGKKHYLPCLDYLSFISIIFFLIYLYINIISVGSFGKALPILFLYFLCSSIILLLTIFHHSFKPKDFEIFNLAILIIFWLWIVFRSLYDLNDLYQLKQITVATTGGIILFYATGFLFRICFEFIRNSENINLIISGVFIIFLILLIWLGINWYERLIFTEFKLDGVSGKYQRPGNFISISYIVISLLITNFTNIKYNQYLIVLYGIISIFLLICSQLIWSNSATGVILGVYLITLFFNHFKFQKKLIELKVNVIFKDKKNLKIIFNSFFFLFLTIVVLISFTYLFGGNFSDLRIFGFGTGLMNSLVLRYDQIIKYGLSQITYSPLFGNMNVAYMVTGNPGITLHSLFLNVTASLGIVGLMMMLTLIWLILKKIIQDIKIKSSDDEVIQRISKIQILVLFLFIILFANISTGFTWAVLWFTIGFSNKIMILDKKKSVSKFTYVC